LRRYWPVKLHDIVLAPGILFPEPRFSFKPINYWLNVYSSFEKLDQLSVHDVICLPEAVTLILEPALAKTAKKSPGFRMWFARFRSTYVLPAIATTEIISFEAPAVPPEGTL
jgi:hypothetical protein